MQLCQLTYSVAAKEAQLKTYIGLQDFEKEIKTLDLQRWAATATGDNDDTGITCDISDIYQCYCWHWW